MKPDFREHLLSKTGTTIHITGPQKELKEVIRIIEKLGFPPDRRHQRKNFRCIGIYTRDYCTYEKIYKNNIYHTKDILSIYKSPLWKVLNNET